MFQKSCCFCNISSRNIAAQMRFQFPRTSHDVLFETSFGNTNMHCCFCRNFKKIKCCTIMFVMFNAIVEKLQRSQHRMTHFERVCGHVTYAFSVQQCIFVKSWQRLTSSTPVMINVLQSIRHSMRLNQQRCKGEISTSCISHDANHCQTKMNKHLKKSTHCFLPGTWLG